MGVDFPAGFCYNAGKLSFYLSEALLLQYLTNLWNALDFGSLESILLRVASVFLCLTIHETCHGLAAYALGDPTAKRAHRLSLNPLRHIDWLGLIMMVAAGFGWAKPVPVDPSYFKKPKQGMALTALAGPVSNFLLALLLLLIARGEFLRAVTTGHRCRWAWDCSTWCLSHRWTAQRCWRCCCRTGRTTGSCAMNASVCWCCW